MGYWLCIADHNEEQIYKINERKIRKRLTKIIADELRENYPPYVNPRFKILVQFLSENGISAPFLEDDLEEVLEKGLERMPVPSELELWYHKYLRLRSSIKTTSFKRLNSWNDQ